MIALLAALLAAPAAAEPARGPYLVELTSTSARACWRPRGTHWTDCETFDGLAADAAFTYRVPGSTRAWEARTLPADGAPLVFAAFGDSGQPTDGLAAVGAAVAAARPRLILHLGDVVYPKGEDVDYDEKYFAPYRGFLPRVPVYPAIGNHDYGNYKFRGRGEKRFREAYHTIFRKPKYYSFDAGPVHFVSLDTSGAYGERAAAPIGPGSRQAKWLRADLKRAKRAWTVVFTHVPVFAGERHGDQPFLQKNLKPLLEKGGVDLVLQGHDHVYERSRPIDGIVYVSAGTGGAKLGRRKNVPPWLAKRVMGRFGYVWLEADATTLRWEFRAADGRVLDRFKLEKRP